LAFVQLSNGQPVDVECLDMPVLKVGGRTRLDEYGLAREIDARLKDGAEPITAAIIEQGGVMRPGNGRIGVAAFWLGLGAVRGILAAHFIRMEEVTPAAWKRDMRVTGDKDECRQRASSIYPKWAGQWSRAKDHGRAEAALIAFHGANRFLVLDARKIA
jgi:crossover junction endodeoxyribonuclease RuvC